MLVSVAQEFELVMDTDCGIFPQLGPSQPVPPAGLSIPQIAGISVGVSAVIGIAVGVIVYLRRRSPYLELSDSKSAMLPPGATATVFGQR